MGCKIIFAPQATADLAEAVRHIAREDPETALRVGNALIDRVAILENFPLIGSPYPKRPGVRKLVSRPSSFSIAQTRKQAALTFSGTGMGCAAASRN